MDYKKLLEKARKQLPESLTRKERFEIPKVKGQIQGNRTIISNFYQIASTLNRDPKEIVKFLLKELASPGELGKNALIIGSKVNSAKINEKIKLYADHFIFCPECSKPDTKIEKHENLTYIKCLACGTRRAVKK